MALRVRVPHLTCVMVQAPNCVCPYSVVSIEARGLSLKIWESTDEEPTFHVTHTNTPTCKNISKRVTLAFKYNTHHNVLCVHCIYKTYRNKAAKEQRRNCVYSQNVPRAHMETEKYRIAMVIYMCCNKKKHGTMRQFQRKNALRRHGSWRQCKRQNVKVAPQYESLLINWSKRLFGYELVRGMNEWKNFDRRCWTETKI